MANLDSLEAEKYIVMPAVRTSRRKIFVFEFIYCTNVPPYGSYASTLPTTAASECEKDAGHGPGDSVPNYQWKQVWALDTAQPKRSPDCAWRWSQRFSEGKKDCSAAVAVESHDAGVW